MKKTFKFMTMALAAVVMAGVTVSCDPMDKDDEQVEQEGDQPGNEDGGEVVEFPTPDLKQWVLLLEGESTAYFIDLGLKKPNILCFGYCNPETYESMQAMSQGEYVFTATSATAGVLEISTVDWDNNPIVYEYQYSELTENSFKIDSNFLYGGVTGDEITWIKFTLSPVNIEFEDMYDLMY